MRICASDMQFGYPIFSGALYKIIIWVRWQFVPFCVFWLFTVAHQQKVNLLFEFFRIGLKYLMLWLHPLPPNLSCSLFAWLSQSPFKNNILLITFYLLKIISNWSHFTFLKILSNWSLFVFHDHNLASHDHSSSQITFVLNQFMTLMDLLIMFTCYQRHHFQ